MINGINGISGAHRYGGSETAKPSGQAAVGKSSKAAPPEQVAKADTVEISQRQESPVTYKKVAGKKLDETQIASLKAEAEAATENLRKLVEQLILNQNKNYKISAEDRFNDAVAKAGITAADVEAAKQAVSEDGEFGVKAVSDRLVNFAITVSGGDKSKLSQLVSAIDKGFAAAKKILGGTLPEISQRTYDETMRKLNEWANATETDA